jgi:hypothetical protein
MSTRVTVHISATPSQRSMTHVGHPHGAHVGASREHLADTHVGVNVDRDEHGGRARRVHLCATHSQRPVTHVGQPRGAHAVANIVDRHGGHVGAMPSQLSVTHVGLDADRDVGSAPARNRRGGRRVA